MEADLRQRETSRKVIRRFPVVLGTDGSRMARAAIATTLAFPWPEGAEVLGVVATRPRSRAGRPEYVREAFDRAFRAAARAAEAKLAGRWPGAAVHVIDASPAVAILREAEHVRAKLIVLGCRGRGPVRRLFAGSVSRSVARHARCAVLVVNSSRRIRRLVVGLDGSANARRAVHLIRGFTPPRGGSVTLVTALGPSASPKASRGLDRSADLLRTAGWRVTTVLKRGVPLATLLSVVRATDADLLVLGARGVTALERLLVGSVAEGALSRCPVPVLLAR
jgi:nucleotide-binding universal stress UspA family protein